jgi:Cysteine-rich CPCC
MDSKQKYTCPCCGYKTFDREDHLWDICEVCFWQSCPVQNVDPQYPGGPNRISLAVAQENFINFGACENDSLAHVRPPMDDEPKDANWQLVTTEKYFKNAWGEQLRRYISNYEVSDLKDDTVIFEATLNHRFSVDLTYEENAKYVLKIKEGNTWIHFFNYMLWHEAATATNKWLNEIEEVAKTIAGKKADEEKSFDVRVNIDNTIVASKLTTWRNMDWDVEKFRNIQIEIRDETYSIVDTFTDFENMLIALQKSLPENYKIETCFFCRFSGYFPARNDNFGALDCFKKCKEQFIEANDKHTLIDLYESEKDSITKVEETHYCEEFEQIKSEDWAYKNQINSYSL